MMTNERPCTNCGESISAEASFCVKCGAAQGPDVVPWRGLDALWVFLIHLGIVAVVVGVMAAFASGDALTIGGVIVSEFALFVTTVAWVSIKYGRGPRDLGLRDANGSNIGFGVLIGVVGLIISAVLSTVLIRILEAVQGTQVEQPEQIDLSGDPEGALLVLLGLGVVLLAPLAEETFFRGLLYRGLRKWAKPAVAIVLSAAIFAVVHVFPLVMLPIFGLGVLLAWVVEKRRGIVSAIVAHMTFNAVGFAVLFTDAGNSTGAF